MREACGPPATSIVECASPRGRVRHSGEAPPNGQATTFAVGLVIFHLLTFPEGFAYNGATLQGPIAACIRQIYPSTPPFEWPFGPALTDNDAFDLGDKIAKMYKHLVERPPGATSHARDYSDQLASDATYRPGGKYLFGLNFFHSASIALRNGGNRAFFTPANVEIISI